MTVKTKVVKGYLLYYVERGDKLFFVDMHPLNFHPDDQYAYVFNDFTVADLARQEAQRAMPHVEFKFKRSDLIVEYNNAFRIR